MSVFLSLHFGIFSRLLTEFKIYTFVHEGQAKVWDMFSPTECVRRRKMIKEVQGGTVLHLIC